MKYSLILFLLLPFFSRSQDCNLKTSKDPYTKELKLSTGLITLNNGQYSIEATKSEIDFMFSLEEKCFDDASTASIFFEGTKTKTNLKAEKRDQKNRKRMHLSGASLRKPSKHAGMSLIKIK